MNTTNLDYVPVLPAKRKRDYVIIHDGLEFVFHKQQLKKIKDMHNDGVWITDIADQIERNEYETLFALLHLHRQGRLTRPIGRILK